MGATVFAMAPANLAGLLLDITVSQPYPVLRFECDGFYIADDVGQEIYCLWEGCAHLKGGDWLRLNSEDRRIVASVNATAGISVEALEAGCIAELVEAGRALLQFEGHMVWCGHGRDDTRPCVCGYLDAQDRLRATLAKVKGEAA